MFLGKLSTDVDVCGPGVDGCTGNDGTLDKLMGVATDDLAIFAGSRLALVSVDYEEAGAAGRLKLLILEQF